MRIVWLNTWCLPHITTLAHIKKVARYISTEAKRNSADVIALGEVFGETNKREMISQIQENVGRIQSIESPCGGWITQDSGLLVLLAEGTQCLAVHFETFDTYHLWDGLAAKGFLGVHVENRDKERFLVVATHLQNAEVGFSLSSGKATAVAQIHQLLCRTWIWANCQPLVVVGDFNIEPGVMETSLSCAESEFFQVLQPICGTTRDTHQIFDYAIASRAHKPLLVKTLLTTEDVNPSDHLAIFIRDDTNAPITWRGKGAVGGEASGSGYQRATIATMWVLLYSIYQLLTSSNGWGVRNARSSKRGM